MKLESTKNFSITSKDFGNVVLKVHQFQMNTPASYFGVFTLAEGIESGFEIGGIMGACVARNLEDALRKSSIECFRNVSALSTHSHSSINFDQFIKIKKPSSEDSQNLLFNRQYCKTLLDTFSQSTVTKESLSVNLENLIFERLDYSSSVLRDCPLKFVRCLVQNRNPAPDTEFVG